MLQRLRCLLLVPFLALASVVWLQTTAAAAELIMIEEDGCPWCARWNAEIGPIYAKTEEGRRAPLRRVDMYKALPADLAFLDKGRYTPTFVVVDQGREIDRIRGYPGEDFFWSLLDEILARIKPTTGEQARAPVMTLPES